MDCFMVTEQQAAKHTIPDDVLVILPVRNLVVFPGAITQIALGRDVSIIAAKEAVEYNRKLGVLLQRDPSVDEPTPSDLHEIGTIVSVVRFITAPNGMHYLICRQVPTPRSKPAQTA
jgi:ATP-dependent Lon protease